MRVLVIVNSMQIDTAKLSSSDSEKADVLGITVTHWMPFFFYVFPYSSSRPSGRLDSQSWAREEQWVVLRRRRGDLDSNSHFNRRELRNPKPRNVYELCGLKRPCLRVGQYKQQLIQLFSKPWTVVVCSSFVPVNLEYSKLGCSFLARPNHRYPKRSTNSFGTRRI